MFPLDSGLDLRSLWLDARKGGRKRRPALDWITSKPAGLASQSGVSSMPPQMEIVEDESHIAGEDRHGSMSLICMAPPDLVLI